MIGSGGPPPTEGGDAATPDPVLVAEIIAAFASGERMAARRARDNVALAPDERTRRAQEDVAAREEESLRLLEARVGELGSPDLEERFHPYFEAFFEATVPGDWVEAQMFHYVGDALVADFGDAVIPAVDPVSAEVLTAALLHRDDQDAFALDQITAALRENPGAAERVAAYARRVAGEALTQTRRGLDATEAFTRVLGGEEGEKRVLLGLLDRHRRRLDRLGIEAVDDPPEPA